MSTETSLHNGPPLPEAAATSRDAAAACPGRDGRLRAAAEAAIEALHRGGARCIPVPGTFPPQFLCAGTADQIDRLLREPAS